MTNENNIFKGHLAVVVKCNFGNGIRSFEQNLFRNFGKYQSLTCMPYTNDTKGAPKIFSI